MGLAFHYQLSVSDPLDETAVRELVGQARMIAKNAEADSVSRLIRVEPDFPLAHEWVSVPTGENESTYVDVPPESGHVFLVEVGRDCEALLLGLCRYPSMVEHEGRKLRTGRHGWELRHCCKTQYASLHGWEYFLRCHRLAIELVNGWRSLGVRVRITDEGGWWPRRSEKTLRGRLDQMNGIVAAMGGALKDAGEGMRVESPIFGHPQFEVIEHRGMQEFGSKVRQAASMVKRIADEAGGA